MAAPLLSVEGLTKSYGVRLLFGDLSFGISEGDKIGIVARNGSGKSTMLRIIAGHESPDSGRIVARNGLKIGYLEQKPDYAPELTVAEAALHRADGEETRRRLTSLLTRMGITDTDARIGTLSGGQRKRIALAEVLVHDPDLLILDEPTNHLDVQVIEWLEGYLKRSRTALLMVTHDRYFLDRVCNRIFELADRTIYAYDGNYNYYLRRRAERIEAMTAELARVRNTLRKEQEWMSRQPQARGGKARYRIDAFHDLKDRERAGIRPERDVELRVRSSYIGSKIFEAEHVGKAFGDKVILRDFSYVAARGEKVGILGANGVGKTTFIKMLQGLEPADTGKWTVGDTVRFGYYSQDGMDFDSRKRVIDAVTEIAEEVDMGTHTLNPMQFLNKFLFTPQDQQKYIHTLSGGELARLHLAVTLMRRPNFLILDEPTNDLDIMTLAVLEDYLANFKGCVIVVSHDRYFLDRVVDHLFVFEGDGKVRDFPGDYSTYRHCVAQERAAKRSEASGKGAEGKNGESTASAKDSRQDRPRTEQKRKMSFKERREYEQLQVRLEELTRERADLEASMNSGTLPHDRLAEAGRRIQELIDEIDTDELRLLELMELE